MAITYAACDQSDLEYILDSFMQNDTSGPAGIYDRFKLLHDELTENQRSQEQRVNTHPSNSYATWASQIKDTEAEVTDKDWATCPF